MDRPDFSQYEAGTAFGQTPFSVATLLLAISLSAGWQLTFVPYVADYSRYLPSATTVGSTFWHTRIGIALGVQIVMTLCALVAVVSGADTTAQREVAALVDHAARANAARMQGGLAARPWALRVTLVFRRDGRQWQLVHRHAAVTLAMLAQAHSAGAEIRRAHDTSRALHTPQLRLVPVTHAMKVVLAHSLAAANASNAVLVKLGMPCVAELPHARLGAVWRYRVDRPASVWPHGDAPVRWSVAR